MNLEFAQIFVLTAGLISIVLSIIFFEKGKTKQSLLLMVLGSIGLGLFFAMLDPFLNIWDESYHALVAKNMIDHPITPMLYKTPILDYDYKLWTDNHIWIHKQPLFLWQMALSMKIFGINELSVRIPDVIMHAIIPLLMYRIGKISTNDSRIAFFGALFFSVAFYPLELVAGTFATDHNDTAFLFYIFASFWAWFEYTQSEKPYWLVLIGIFSGCAVLVKWLMGLLVFVCWGFTLLFNKENLFRLKVYIPIVISFAIALLIFLPWQIYVLSVFPTESSFEFNAYSQHFSTPLEGHGESLWFHFQNTGFIYGNLLIILSILTGFVILFKRSNLKLYRIFIFGSILFVYIFYSLAQTKMRSFIIVVSPFIYLCISSTFVAVIDYIHERLSKKIIFWLMYGVICCLFIYSLMQIENTNEQHSILITTYNDSRNIKIREREFIGKFNKTMPDDKVVIFNTNFSQGGNIPFMFYTNHIAYRIIPDSNQIRNLKNMGYKIAIIDFGNLPEYIVHDNEIVQLSPN